MVTSIPASDIVDVVPGVISAGGTGLDMVGLLLTNSARVPIGSVLSFVSQSAVAAYFGSSSDEASAATTYSNGYVNSFIKPAFIRFSRYATADAAAWVRGATLGLTLTELQALAASTMTITVDGVAKTSSSVNLSGASSFSNAATLIQAAFTTPGFTVTYDSVAGAFLFTSNTAGASSTTSYVSGTLATSLKLTLATGATISQGADAMTPGPAMDAIVALTQDWVSFTHLFSQTTDEIVEFATWTNGQDNRYLYVPWTSDAAAITNSDTTSPMALIRAADLSGTAAVYSATFSVAVGVLGYGASLDFNRTNGRTVAAFRQFSGLTAEVTNQTIAANLIANGYSFYGSYGTANDEFTWLYNGQMAGPFAWVDSYLNQIWMNNSFQLSLMVLLGAIGQIPYNDDGYETIGQGIQSDINRALSFGAIRSGVTLTESQKVIVNGIAGQDISDVLFTRGWYLSVLDPGGTTRAARGSPVCTFFFVDGQSVQRIILSSLQVQ